MLFLQRNSFPKSAPLHPIQSHVANLSSFFKAFVVLGKTGSMPHHDAHCCICSEQLIPHSSGLLLDTTILVMNIQGRL